MDEIINAIKRSVCAFFSVIVTGLVISLAAPDAMKQDLKILGNLSLLDIWTEVLIIIDIFCIAYILYTIFINMRIGKKEVK